MQLTAQQEAALAAIKGKWNERAPSVALAGPAGTGKTTMLSAVRDLVVDTRGDDDAAVVVTPTNKAAAVLREKKVDAATLYTRFFTPIETFDGSVRFKPNHEITHYGGTLGEGKLDFADTIILDEASMLQTWLVKHLQKMSHTVVMIGDPHQLPPVGDQANPEGYFCSREPDAELSEVLRQGADSPILTLATEIRQRRFPGNLVRSLAPSAPFVRWYDGSQKIIAFTNAHRRLINCWARKVLGFKGVLPKAGDCMVSNSNLSDDVFNGTEFKIEAFDWTTGGASASAQIRTENGVRTTVLIDMLSFLEDQPPNTVPDKIMVEVRAARAKARMHKDFVPGISVAFSYCITAHKAQGSEYDRVCVIDERFVLNKVDPTGETCRRWLYTAITRARDELVFADFRWAKASAQQGVAA